MQTVMLAQQTIYIVAQQSWRANKLAERCSKMTVITHATVEAPRVPHHLMSMRNGRRERSRRGGDHLLLLLLVVVVVVVMSLVVSSSSSGGSRSAVLGRFFVVLVLDEIGNTSS